MAFQHTRQYEGLRRRLGAVTMLRYPYHQMPGQLDLYPIAYGGEEDEIVFLPSTPSQEDAPSGFQPSAADVTSWVNAGSGLIATIGSWFQGRKAKKQQGTQAGQTQVVYVPQPAPISGTTVALIALLAVGGLAGTYMILKGDE